MEHDINHVFYDIFLWYVSDNQIRDASQKGVGRGVEWHRERLLCGVDIGTKHTILLIFNALARKTCTFYEAAFLSEFPTMKWNWVDDGGSGGGGRGMFSTENKMENSVRWRTCLESRLNCLLRWTLHESTRCSEALPPAPPPPLSLPIVVVVDLIFSTPGQTFARGVEGDGVERSRCLSKILMRFWWCP